MRKLYTIFLIVLCLTGFSQTKNYYWNSWRLGLNMGGMWQNSDLNKNAAGFAGGFTLEKGIFENKTHFFSLAIRGRGLFGSTYGNSSKKNYDIASNPALNGKYNPLANYSDSVGGPKRFVYNNYKTEISEGALELQISFNRLRERTGLILNLWGGVGFSVYRVNTDLLDGNNKMYDFTKVDSTGSTSNIVRSQKNILDRKYESYGQGSQAGDLITFSPSCGIGLGYQFSPRFSMLFEYKVTFPQGMNADLLDGYKGINNHWAGKNNDFYHYTAVNFLFTLGRGGKHEGTTTNNTVNNYPPAHTNTAVVQNNNPPPNNVGVVQGNHVNKPIVNITNPASSPATTNSSIYTVQSKVYNVSQRNQINITFNGAQITNYSFNGSDISFPVNLNTGGNNVIITASNQVGSDSKSAVINYQGLPPVINITYPAGNPYVTYNASELVNATISNINSVSDIQVKLNGVLITNFSFNPQNTQFSTPVNLKLGSNTYEMTASNAFGRDYKTIVINYVTQVNTGNVVVSKPLALSWIDPSTNSKVTKVPNYFIKAQSQGISSYTQAAVTVNGNATNFSFDPNSGIISFNSPLILGNNNIIITARNGKASKTISTILVYELDREIALPQVKIINPGVSPYKNNTASFLFKAQTTNITSTSQLEVKFNGAVTTAYNFNSTGGTIEFNTTLIPKINNLFEVKATNIDGVANASAIVTFNPKVEPVGDPQIIICHKQGDNSQTITILQSQWPIHQAHGDQMGACPIKEEGGTVDPLKTICHKNDDGSKQTIVILTSKWPEHQAHGDSEGPCPKVVGGNGVGADPQIIICHKSDNGSRSTITILQSQWPSHQAHGDVMGACVKVGGTEGGVGVDPDIQICHNNGANLPMQNMTIKQSQWASHQAHGDHLGSCSNSELDPTITICHLPPGNPNNSQQITIPYSAWPAHQAHGDYLGTCTVVADPDITICHKIDSRTNQTMTIKQSQWPAHQAHGDQMGACPTPTVTPENQVMEICHNNGDGSTTTMTIFPQVWPAHQSHGDVIGACQTATVAADPDIQICHSNGPGVPMQNITVKQSQWASHQAHGDHLGSCSNSELDPNISICHLPPGNPNNPQQLTISYSAWPAHQAHGDYLGTCTVVADPDIQICHNQGANLPMQNMTIKQSQWALHQAHGDHQGSCTNKEQDPDISICHLPPGNPNNSQQITIPYSAWPAHQAHGDYLGACNVSTVVADPDIQICHNQGANLPMQNMTIKQSEWASHQAHGDHQGSCTNKEQDPDVSICHIPPGNPNQAHQITVPYSAWPAHQAHGDVMGPCPQNKSNQGGDTEPVKNKDGGDNGRPAPKKEGETSGDLNQTGRPIQQEQPKTEGDKPKTETQDGQSGRTLKPR